MNSRYNQFYWHARDWLLMPIKDAHEYALKQLKEDNHGT